MEEGTRARVPLDWAKAQNNLGTARVPLDWAATQNNLGASLGALGGLKTATLLNGGALVAIPAVITLFGIDPKYIMRGLLFAGGCFILGLVFSWLSTFFGFFTLAHRYDRDFANAETTKINLYRYYYSLDDETQNKKQQAEIEKLQSQSRSHHRAFVIFRCLTLLLSFFSFAAFIAGTIEGGWTVSNAPPKSATSSPALFRAAKAVMFKKMTLVDNKRRRLALELERDHHLLKLRFNLTCGVLAASANGRTP